MTDSKMAYGIYWYDISVSPAIGHGMAGTIFDNGNNNDVEVTPNLNSSLNGDPLVLSFTDTNDNPMLAVTDYEDGQNRNIYIYDYDGNLDYTRTWVNVENPYAIVRMGNYLYALDYDNARVVEIYATKPDPFTDIYTETGKTYTYSSGSYNCHGQALAVYNGTLYGLFSVTDNTWTNYQNSVVIQFDFSTTSVSTPIENSNFEKNAFTLVEQGGYLYVCAIGGRQYSGSYNNNSKLQCVAISGFTSTTTPTTVLDTGDYAYEFRDITFNGSTAYILAGYYHEIQGQTTWYMNGTLVAGTMSGSSFTQSSSDTFTDIPGYYWSVLYTSDNSRVWYAKGNEINILDTTPAISLSVNTLQGGSGSYTNLNDMCYIGADSSAMAAKLRGYRSPLQASRTRLAANLRVKTAGRPEATPEEFEEAKTV